MSSHWARSAPYLLIISQTWHLSPCLLITTAVSFIKCELSQALYYKGFAVTPSEDQDALHKYSLRLSPPHFEEEETKWLGHFK